LNKEGIEMNTILYTTMIKAYSKTKNLNKVLEILDTMIKSKNSKPNIITYNCTRLRPLWKPDLVNYHTLDISIFKNIYIKGDSYE
jgi:pentatricopeptide repeat protein